jgi:hypothetical protein
MNSKELVLVHCAAPLFQVASKYRRRSVRLAPRSIVPHRKGPRDYLSWR